MDASALGVLAQFYTHIDVFLLVFVRVIAFFLLMPVISGSNIPMTIKVLFSLCMAIVIFMSGNVATVSYSDTVAGYFVLMVSEFLTGMLMGFILFFFFNIIYYTGQLIDYQIGLSMMSVLDPVTQIQVPIVGNLYYLAISAMLVVSGGLHSFISAFAYSYRLLPIGVAHLVGNASLAWYAMTILMEFLVLGVKIALPIVGSILVIDAALGIMVKASPQMNVFVVGMPMKLLVGLFLLLSVMAPTMDVIYNYIFDRAYNALFDIVWEMSP